jgi:hypothetical protein
MSDFVGYLVTCDKELVSLTEYLENNYNYFDSLHFQGICIYRQICENAFWFMLQVSEGNIGSQVDDMKTTDLEYCGFSSINNFDHEKTMKKMEKYPQVDISTIKQYFDNNIIDEFVKTWEFIQLFIKTEEEE